MLLSLSKGRNSVKTLNSGTCRGGQLLVLLGCPWFYKNNVELHFNKGYISFQNNEESVIIPLHTKSQHHILIPCDKNTRQNICAQYQRSRGSNPKKQAESVQWEAWKVSSIRQNLDGRHEIFTPLPMGTQVLFHTTGLCACIWYIHSELHCQIENQRDLTNDLIQSFEYQSTKPFVNEVLQVFKHLTVGDNSMVEDRLLKLLGEPYFEACFNGEELQRNYNLSASPRRKRKEM